MLESIRPEVEVAMSHLDDPLLLSHNIGDYPCRSGIVDGTSDINNSMIVCVIGLDLATDVPKTPVDRGQL